MLAVLYIFSILYEISLATIQTDVIAAIYPSIPSCVGWTTDAQLCSSGCNNTAIICSVDVVVDLLLFPDSLTLRSEIASLDGLTQINFFSTGILFFI